MSEPVGFPAFDLSDPGLLDNLNARLGELNEKLEVRFIAATRESVTATMPVAGNRQPANLLHGGASAALAESLGSIHAVILAPAGTMPVGIELNCTHHRSALDGLVTGESTVLSAGRTLATFSIMITDQSGRRVCTARLTCLYRPMPAA